MSKDWVRCGRDLASHDIPCGLRREHPAHIYPGIDGIWFCDGTWPDGGLEIRWVDR